MEVSVIIVNWNSKKDLESCLKSLFSGTKGVDFEVLVIDSGSFDGCGEMLALKFPMVRFVQSDVNLGFSRANNHAFRSSCGKHLLFLNPDTEVSLHAIASMRAALMTADNAGIVGARLLNSDGSLQMSCIQAMPTLLNKMLDSDFLRKRWPRSKLWGTAALFDNNDGPRPVEVVSGACLMIDRKVFERVGLFSEEYFMYAEDVDLSYKVRRLGYRNYYDPSAMVVHHGGGSSAQSTSTFAAVMMPEATRRFFRRTRGRTYAGAFRALMCLCAITRLFLLALGAPLLAWARKQEIVIGSARKWYAVLRWSLHCDFVVKRYYEARQLQSSTERSSA